MCRPPTCHEGGAAYYWRMQHRTAWVMALLAVTVLRANIYRAMADAPLHNTQFLRDYAETRGFTLGRPTRPLPTPQGDAVLFLRAPARTPRLELYEFDIRSGESRLLLTPDDILRGADEHLSAEEKALGERMRVSVGGFTDFQLSKD